MLYSIPFPAEKKGVFSKFSDFFQNGQKDPDWNRQNPQKDGRPVGHPVAQPQEKPAEAPEIDPSPHHAEHSAVQPDAAAPGLMGPEKEGQRGHDPEQQVQRRSQQRDLHPDPEDPEQVVQHPQDRPQQQGLTQGSALLDHVDGHPPSRRLSRPPRSRPLGS